MSTLRRWVREHMPAGRGLPPAIWERRHAGMTRLLVAQATALGVGGVALGLGLLHVLADMTAIVVAVAAARSTRLSPRVRSTAVALGLVGCSAVLVHMADGYIEAHFHFFVMVALLSLYQAWAPFGAAVAFVALHHSIFGYLFPESVFNHGAAIENPLLWSGVHGALLLAASVAALVTWRLNEHQALHDALTGLANRTLLAERLAVACQQPGREVAVVYLDLDDFKGVNDSGGHAVGDELLVAVSRRLADTVRTGDLVARLGGDEFAVLLDPVRDRGEAIEVTRRVLEALAQPFEVGGSKLNVTASAGIAFRDGSADAEAILSHADMAMYVAKHDGKAQYEVFHASMHRAALARLQLEAELHEAIEQGQLVVHYQPVVSMPDGDVLGLEALVRWQHPDRGLVGPDVFIPLAEETGLVVPLGRWVLDRACADVARWNRERAGDPLYLSVNVSPRQLRSGIAATVGHALVTSGLDPRSLVLEVTEGAFVGHDDAEVDPLHELRTLGVRIAVDDFGTGYSSLNYLRRLPVDVVKIDRSFVSDLAAGTEDEALVDAIVRLCRALGLLVIAEGVERAEEAEVLRRLGVRTAQGFLFARPASAADVAQLLGPPRAVEPAPAGPALDEPAAPVHAVR